MSDKMAYQQQLQQAMMDVIAQVTRIPFGTYECQDGRLEEIIPDSARTNFEPFCKRLHSFQGGRDLCELDQQRRARAALLGESTAPVVLCHAGVPNRHQPIKINDEVKAVLIHGEAQTEEHIQESFERCNQVAHSLGLSADEAAQLRELLRQVGRYSPDQQEAMVNLVTALEKMRHYWIEEERQMRYTIETINHEIVTRVQGVVARAENVQRKAGTLTPLALNRQLEEIIERTYQLNAVLQNLGDYFEEYNFEKQSIEPILRDSVRTYEVQAAGRGISIILNLIGADEPSRQLEVSEQHLQYAINNLLHNVIKYSFFGAHNRQRYIKIHGQPDKDYYQIAISNYGIGILPEEISSGKIFEDGYQGKLTSKELRTGSGKGLNFVKKVIERHHGRIEVTSKLVAEEAATPQGEPHSTRFTIYLPYCQPKEMR